MSRPSAGLLRYSFPLLLAGALAAPHAIAGGVNTIFQDGFEDAAPTANQAARFLSQAAFGATDAEIDAVVAQGYAAWIAQQRALPPTLARAFIETVAVTENTAGRNLDANFRLQHWIDTAVTAPDQLRQKTAYALSQFLVVSDLDGTLFDQPVMMSEWNDILVRNALGNYRTLIEDVARSPMMGQYLSHLRNRKFEVTPKCYDKRTPLDDNTNPANDNGGTPVLDATDYHLCTSADATNNNTMTPTIAAYQTPTTGLVAPDENFAREVMQLFSIGLLERDLDFDPILVGGDPVPTYDQAMIVTMARVMTGFTFACSGTRTVAGQTINRTCGCTGVDCNYSTGLFGSVPPSLSLGGQDDVVHPDRYEPMTCYPRYHDTGRDRTGYQLPGEAAVAPAGAALQLALGETIPGGTPPADKVLVLGGATLDTIQEASPGLAPGASTLNCDAAAGTTNRQACVDYCNDDLDRALDVLFNHPNTATMVARQLIQHMVTSNPSPAYIERVAQTFVNNGSNVRGDLGAVVTAILTDSEARTAPAGNSGKPQEPFLKLIRMWRAMGAVSGEVRADGYQRWARFRAGCQNLAWPHCNYLQRPLGATSVFNFYSPDYQQPGAIATAGLYTPEFQIINENTSVLTANDLALQLCSGYGNDDCEGALTIPTNGAYIPTAALDALPGGSCGNACTGSDDAALIAELDLRLMSGAMSGAIGDTSNPGSVANTGMRGALFRLLQTGLTGAIGPTAQDGRRREILYTVHLILVSPEFAVQP